MHLGCECVLLVEGAHSNAAGQRLRAHRPTARYSGEALWPTP